VHTATGRAAGIGVSVKRFNRKIQLIMRYYIYPGMRCIPQR
jgi:hypothetical protein